MVKVKAQLSFCRFFSGIFLLVLGAARARSDGVLASQNTTSIPTLGLRRPPSQASLARAKNDTCHAGALCVGPGRMYPLGRVRGVIWSSRYVVPELPAKFDSVQMTYYDYLNVFWRTNPLGGYMNQFVPQLMLGTALANSTNAPEYKPLWIELSTWHIGAQYFMGLCDGSSGEYDCQHWIPRAATGKLIPVEPGEVVETSFALEVINRCCSEAQFVWTLRIGVVGGGIDRQSVVVSDRPFMGLVNTTMSWGESIYDNIYVGSCLENYDMQSADNYPPKWEICVEVKDAPGRDEDFWHAWRLEHEPGCPWQPVSMIANAKDKRSQHIKWKAELSPSGARGKLLSSETS